jgi:hypothetical protein
VKKKIIFLTYHFCDPYFAPRQKKDTYELGRPFATLGINVAAIKYCCF